MTRWISRIYKGSKYGKARPTRVDRIASAIRRANTPKPDSYPVWDRQSETKADYATRLRAHPTVSEVILGQRLRLACESLDLDEPLPQSVQYGYILDFYFPFLRLAFEADGRQHNRFDDRDRDRNLSQRGIQTIRFSSDSLRNDIKTVDSIIRRTLK